MSLTDPNIVDTEPNPVDESLPDTGQPDNADAGLTGSGDVDIDATPERGEPPEEEMSDNDVKVDRNLGS
ncbi:hypothetical protein Tter_0849 [Thermobaculum terrenum ATCC BAA-798]|uniref:Uncharacterized protein n=1 Tax=Thermobaculum terrenum (strain ATCC BAA-798 / CCMEE 7001 / YNP1) TaxID=525904 RepID=D1CFR0_THET1|nr:hypothetical protein [Thermobaculum terrenum]ACZ41766.1 hypothetical protein Tter_0849 [Thermobaculum terrenum ATCC BAA-798]